MPAAWRKKRKHVFCSEQCRLTPIVPAVCSICGSAYLIPAQGSGRAKFCSRACYNEHNKRIAVHKRFATYPVTCEYCGKVAYARAGASKVQRFCSASCFGHWLFETHGNPALTSIAKRPRTDIEVAMASALTRAGIEYQEQVLFFDKFLVDFYLPSLNLIVQCDGIYWHTKPGVATRDKGQDNYFKKCGLTVKRFTDKQIYKNVDACVSQLQVKANSGNLRASAAV